MKHGRLVTEGNPMSNTKKRKAGRNKTRKKQREYKEYCRVMRTTGHVTDQNGIWTTSKPATCAKSIDELLRMTGAK
jgi:hypothetical protein